MKKIAWSTIVQLLGKGVQIFLGILAVKLITNALGAENYGVYGKISEFSIILSTMANFGIFGNTVRRMATNPHDSTLIGNALILRLWTASGLFILGLLYAIFAIKDPVFLWGTIIFMSSLMLDFIATVAGGALQANYLMGRSEIALILGRLTNLAVIFVLATLTLKTELYFLGPLAASILTAGISLWFVKKHVGINFKLSWQTQKELLFSSVPFGIINVINILYFRAIPSFLAAKILSEAEFASYEICLRIALTGSLLSTFLMFSSLPVLKVSLQKKDLKEAKKLLLGLEKILVLSAILLVVFGYLLAPFAIETVSNKTFLIPGFTWMLPLMLVLAAISYFYDLALISAFAMGKEVLWLKMELLALILSLLLLSPIYFGYFPFDPVLKELIVIFSAILGEGFMALSGIFLVGWTLFMAPQKPSL
ncbi:MAG: oligosaccharide flippase family protein [Candidatus Gracilibacteria bacterium]|jgi:O-antigen/teichoic acid export membrane protein